MVISVRRGGFSARCTVNNEIIACVRSAAQFQMQIPLVDGEEEAVAYARLQLFVYVHPA